MSHAAPRAPPTPKIANAMATTQPDATGVQADALQQLLADEGLTMPGFPVEFEGSEPG